MSGRKEMRAIRVANYGGPEVLQVDPKVPVPVPSDTQVLVEVKAAGVNPVDTYIRSGSFGTTGPLPYTPGADAAGIVSNVGAKVTKFKPGDKVYVVRTVSGGYAEFTVAEESNVGKLPSHLSFSQGAGLGIPCYSASRAFIKAKCKVKPGNTVLVHGASGAVGLACVQIGKAKGLTVLGTAGTKEGMDLVLKHGAAKAFNHKEQGYIDKVLEATNGTGPDIIIEMLASVNLATDLKIINKGGIIVVVGSRGNAEIAPGLLQFKESIVTGFALWNAPPEEWVEMHQVISEGLTKRWLVPSVQKEYKLEEASLAHEEIINNPGTMGNRILIM
ncbi:zeta-crystallin-like isoform X2 [Dreissena polymorpha]|uniref:zeta-crystallin-like isoform X2 n=1 Tax=Dreissena polymorpha TaxID=45954 RepID=UPI002263B1B3|nr:zeta-crystallin-like isoform X2 [Dreissena polymorpha]